MNFMAMTVSRFVSVNNFMFTNDHSSIKIDGVQLMGML